MGVVKEVLLNGGEEIMFLGGFYMAVRFGFATLTATNRWLVGMTNSTAAIANADPSAILNFVGIGKDAGDSSIYFMHNDGSGAATKALGSVTMAAPAVGEVFDARIYCKPNGTSFSMSIENWGGSISQYDSGVSTNIPASSLPLTWNVWANTATTNAIIDPHLVSLYIETDY